MRTSSALAFALFLFACGSESSEPSVASDSASTEPSPSSSSTGGVAPAPAAKTPAPVAPSPGTGAPYPVVLAHGFFGFETLAGIDSLTYFYGVQDHLASRGETQVFTPAVDPFNDSTRRGAQLLDHVREILKQTGAAKVNLIGHSQGGLDVRVVAHEHPELVASVTTISTPHHALKLADMAFGLEPGSLSAKAVDAIVKFLGGPLWDEAGEETSLAKAVKQFSSLATADFNAKYTDAPGVPYFSVAGRTGVKGGGVCDTPDAPAWMNEWRNVTDPVNPLLSAAWLINGGKDPMSDGFVSVETSIWGTFIGCVPADHLEEIGQILGVGPGIGNHWDHRQFYGDLLKYLRDRGL